jgi:hypothetical protein
MKLSGAKVQQYPLKIAGNQGEKPLFYSQEVV